MFAIVTILGNTVKNKDAFMVLHEAFLRGRTSHIGNGIIDAMINIYKCDPANFFILEPVHSLSAFLECLENKNQDVQVCGCVLCYCQWYIQCGTSVIRTL